MDVTGTLRPRLLIVEDSEDLRELWLAWLGHSGFDVELAGNGAEAIERALAYLPDLVLMDLWMPVMDGLEATQRLRRHPKTSGLKIVALTAQGGPEIVGRVHAAGCDYFIGKPVSPDDLLDCIHRVLQPS